MYVWMYGWMNAWMAGWLAGWLAGWMDGWMDGCIKASLGDTAHVETQVDEWICASVQVSVWTDGAVTVDMPCCMYEGTKA